MPKRNIFSMISPWLELHACIFLTTRTWWLTHKSWGLCYRCWRRSDWDQPNQTVLPWSLLLPTAFHWNLAGVELLAAAEMARGPALMDRGRQRNCRLEGCSTEWWRRCAAPPRRWKGRGVARRARRAVAGCIGGETEQREKSPRRPHGIEWN